MKVYIKNIEPAWVKYGLVVEIPDEHTDAEVEEAALQKVHDGDFEVAWGPEVIDQIDGMDQEFEVQGFDRGEVAAP